MFGAKFIIGRTLAALDHYITTADECDLAAA